MSARPRTGFHGGFANREVYGPLRFLPVAALPSSPSKGMTVVLDADGHLYTYNGSSWVDNGAAAGGSGLSEYQVRQRVLLLG